MLTKLWWHQRSATLHVGRINVLASCIASRKAIRQAIATIRSARWPSMPPSDQQSAAELGQQRPPPPLMMLAAVHGWIWISLSQCDRPTSIEQLVAAAERCCQSVTARQQRAQQSSSHAWLESQHTTASCPAPTATAAQILWPQSHHARRIDYQHSKAFAAGVASA